MLLTAMCKQYVYVEWVIGHYDESKLIKNKIKTVLMKLGIDLYQVYKFTYPQEREFI